jgi:hypothetical protein
VNLGASWSSLGALLGVLGALGQSCGGLGGVLEGSWGGPGGSLEGSKDVLT